MQLFLAIPDEVRFVALRHLEWPRDGVSRFELTVRHHFETLADCGGSLGNVSGHGVGLSPEEALDKALSDLDRATAMEIERRRAVQARPKASLDLDFSGLEL